VASPETVAPEPAVDSRVAGAAGPLSTPVRATAISRSLKQVARKVRRPTGLWSPPGGSERRWQRTFIPGVIIAFFVVGLLPALLSGGYLLFVASDQYSSEARFAVRGGEFALMDSSGSAIKTVNDEQMQDTLIVYDYIQGRGIVEELQKSIDLRKIFSRSGVDFLSRFNPDKPIEKLVYYWQSHVDVSIDPMSGIITVTARAFTPQDALLIANAIIASSEKVVNDLSERSLRDTLQQSETELKIAEKNLRAKVRDFRDLRNQEGLVDADKSADLMTKMAAELQLQLIQLEQEYAVQRRSVSASAPQSRILENRIESLRDQLKKLTGKITNGDGDSDANGRVLSDSMSRFDREKIEQAFAQQQYVKAAAFLETARALASTQQIYLATFLRPVLAEYPLYPHSIWIWSVIAIVSLILWGVGVGLAVLIRDHIAV